MLTVGIFVVATAFVLLFAWYTSRDVDKDDKSGFFLGGRSLTAGVIAIGLLLSNTSATHFVGFAGDTWWGNLSTIGFDLVSGLCIVVSALYLIPRYLKQGVTTMHDFLEQRYDRQTKSLATWIIIFAYMANMLPITLYSGSVVLVQLFHIDQVLGVDFIVAIILCVVCIAIFGCIYALYGGLKMVATADIINGAMLLIGGALVVIFGFKYLGDGEIVSGVTQVFTQHTEKLNAIGSPTDINPWATNLTGVFLLCMYFWGMDQAILQRAVSAKNLKHGQKGLLWAGFLKVLDPLLLMIPGLIAYQVFAKEGIMLDGSRDLVYSTLVNIVMPKPLLGIFAAAMFGAVLSTFSGLLNSQTTLIAVNVIAPRKKGGMDDGQLVSVGKKCGVVIAIVAAVIAPILYYTPSGIFSYLQMINGFTNVPILIMLGVGYLNKRVPAFAAKMGAFIHIIGYLLSFVLYPNMNYLHRIGINFVIAVVFMLIMGVLRPKEDVFELKNAHVVKMVPWKYRYEFSAFLVAIVVSFYILCSPLGFVGGLTSMTWVYLAVGIVASVVLMMIVKKLCAKSEAVFYADCEEEEGVPVCKTAVMD